MQALLLSLINVSSPLPMQPLHHQLCQFQQAPAELFAKLAHLPYAMLLDAASPTHVDNNYSILVCSPKVVITTQQGVVRVDEPQSTAVLYRSSEQDPFSVIDAMCNQYCPHGQTIDGIPFIGGALGYLSYDLGHYFEPVPAHASRDIKLPDSVVGIYQWALLYHHQQQQYHFVSQIGPEPLAELMQLLADDSVDTAANEFMLETRWQANMTKAQYASKFTRVQQYLRSGDCYQINLAQRFSACYSGNEWLAYQQLRAKNQAPFSAFLRLPIGAILSLSPERFIKIERGIAQTKPIKGTRPRFSEPERDQQSAEELRHSAKDQAENVMIVDLLRNDLGKVATPGSVTVPELFAIESFPAVHHLVSTVTCQVAAEYTAMDVLRAAFPGGSITGAPKVRAMQIIEELEPHQRSVYCGSIFYASACGNMDSNIAIRTLVADGSKLHCWAGGGIVADSDVDAEYQETFDKVNKILPILDF